MKKLSVALIILSIILMGMAWRPGTCSDSKPYQVEINPATQSPLRNPDGSFVYSLDANGKKIPNPTGTLVVQPDQTGILRSYCSNNGTLTGPLVSGQGCWNPKCGGR